eukprot:snap_masked-scaffold131_size323982-processed-gene-0.7 protein:Tk05541 transcript:snap_masked-scaffold131_size323982-processed-gene-0.7-mRNA-1 annotation:"nicotinic acetylcholine receptor a6 subunit isoform xix"
MSIFGFYLPPESGEKITLEITVLMALTFYMNMVTELTPQSSETPLLGIYFSCIMVMVAASVMRKMEEANPPSQSLLNNVLNLDDNHCRHPTHKFPEYQGFRLRECCRDTAIIDPVQVELKSILDEIQYITNRIQKKVSPNSSSEWSESILKDTFHTPQDRASQVENDWKYAAMVLDRLSLLIFTLLTLLLSIACLISAPKIVVY